ncbi:DUF3784 domain-containing protein [Oceanirhabdus sp. W0125-5]|uniref:DUF3784 domain-containing protein n=1 Tax=Oceanirhabdus sp. W0125-5 TaxID=2999116 RepID=UPI0022F2C823|nr:DUF3784 domain-containing protein [Oceanirhabdus sp. W0125-5]WBW96488.1 DUF3784 domain-containing protein [Oceanirhabdus sp. W0125-5]
MNEGQGAILILTMFIGIFCTFIGWVSKSQNAGDMINGFDPKKHDKKKVSKIFGNHFLFIGLSVIAVGIIGMILTKVNPNIFLITQSGIFIIGILKTIYSILRHGKIDKE